MYKQYTQNRDGSERRAFFKTNLNQYILTITITHKGTTVTIQEVDEITADSVIKIISETIDKINQTCSNCTVKKSEGYGK